MTPEQRAFSRYLRPRLAELLGAIGLDVAYHRAEGDRMWFRDAGGEEVCVLDMLGGFGAGLYGHNHPALVATARSVLDAHRPMLAQASVRPLAALLAERLSLLVGGITGRDYVVTLASSGAEAVEAAAKHAELAAMEAIDRLVADQRKALRQIRVGLRAGTISATPAEEAMLGLDGFDDLC